MNADQILQDARNQGAEVLEPVSKWGSSLSPSAQAFFAGSTDGVSEQNATMFFMEAMNVSESNQASAIANVYSTVRGSSRFYGSLSQDQCVTKLQGLLGASSTSACDKAAALLSGVMCRNASKFDVNRVRQVLGYNGSEEGKLETVANFLKFDAWRAEVWQSQCNRALSGLESSSVPCLYKALTCVWLASFSVTVPTTVVATINNILRTSRTEKTVRMALMVIENLLKSKNMCEELAECETVSIVSQLEYEKWRDADLVDLVAQVTQKLNTEVKLLTNFERFEREVNSGTLKWGFIHSERFWLDNVLKCEGNNFRVIDHLMAIVRTNKSPESLAVACHDLGEFARLHPVGKQIATTRGAKDAMLELMSNSQREVAREALLCVQKLMLQKAADLSAVQAV